MPFPGSQSYEDSFDSEESNSSTFMFVSQQQHTQQSLYPTTVNDSPHGWPPYDQTLLPPFQSQPLPYRGFPTPAPYPAPRLSSPLNIAGGGHAATTVSRLSLAGSLDPATGIFYRTPEHPRLRTAQACEKCRTRKAKCSGEHPSCKRCINRGLVCEYAKEGRVRGPNKIKNTANTTNPSLKNTSASAAADLEQHGRTSGATGSINSADHIGTSSYAGDRSETREQVIHSEEGSPVSPSPTRTEALRINSPSGIGFIPVPQQQQQQSPHTSSLSQELYALSSSATSSEPPARRNSLTAVGLGLGEHRSSRPRPPNLGLDAANQWRQDLMGGNNQAGWTNQTNVGLGLNGLGAELGVDLQDSQHQYERQRLAQQQRYLQEQRRLAIQQQHRMLQQPSSSGGFEPYHQTQTLQSQHTSLSMLPPQQQQCTQIYQSHQVFTPAGDYAPLRGVEYPSGAYTVTTQAYQGQVEPAIGHGGSYQGALMGIEDTEQGLHPSLSRIGRRMESISNERSGTENAVGDCGGGMNRGMGGIEGDDRAGWA